MFDNLSLGGIRAAWRFFTRLDVARRMQGSALDVLGWGPQPTPARILLDAPGVRLLGYATGGAGPPVVLVPAPIKRAYIWDLAPGASVVAACLAARLRPYLVTWETPDPQSGIADLVERKLGACVAAAARDSGQDRVFLAGHSLGGLLAAAYAARQPEGVAGLILLAAPLHFSHELSAGAFGPVIAEIERINLLAQVRGNLPGSFLSAASFMASPGAFGHERMKDWLRCGPDPAARAVYLRVERWALDELPLARQLVADLVALHRDDAFVRGGLRIGERAVGVAQVTAPLFTVADRRCAVVPPAAALAAHEQAASAEKRLLWYEGDTGVAIQHVGVLIGRNALGRVWPQILEWVGAHAGAVAA